MQKLAGILTVSTALILCGFVGCSGLKSPAWDWIETSVSPVTDHQGYATDGFSHYTVDTQAIRKRDYTTWAVSSENTSPFSGLTGYNHLGDADYNAGRLYVPIGHYGTYPNTCLGDANPAIEVFDANTLTRLEVHPIPAARDPSALAVAPDQGSSGTIYIAPYCDSEHLYAYDLDTYALLSTITLSLPLSKMQGIAYRNGLLYITTDHPGVINVVSPTGQVQGVVYGAEIEEAEGIDYSQNEIRWLYRQDGEYRVHYLSRKSP